MEIADVVNDSSFTLVCTLNGIRKYSDPSGSNTTYLNDKKYILNVKHLNGKLTLENCDVCSSANYPVIGSILLGYPLNFNQPASSDTIKFAISGNPWDDNYSYSILMNVGLTNFKSSYFDGTTAKSISYKLINHDLK